MSIILKNRNRGGFTLVELMVTMAIIGILAAIAVPQYRKYQATARQNEAKIALGAVYASELAFFSGPENSFTLCLNDIGYALARGSTNGSTANTGGNNYYAIGFDDGLDAVKNSKCGSKNVGVCNARSWQSDDGSAVQGTTCAPGDGTSFYQAGTVGSRDGSPVTAKEKLPLTAINRDSFIIGAAGSIGDRTLEDGKIGDGSAKNYQLDQWTINEKKQLVNVQSGI